MHLLVLLDLLQPDLLSPDSLPPCSLPPGMPRRYSPLALFLSLAPGVLLLPDLLMTAAAAIRSAADAWTAADGDAFIPLAAEAAVSVSTIGIASGRCYCCCDAALLLL